MESFVSKSLTFLILIVPAVVPQKDTHCYWASTNRVWRMSSFTESFQFVFCVKGGETTRNEVLSRTFKISDLFVSKNVRNAIIRIMD
eukprot:MONOS_14486.1-p1 / transcript=MONOS_14486.1 / gene=MONOS_14486 / organism=Monocercomonoides_exilis_PA203 / gene_product=unspecified product / transcript_product=unspecified product / location=Mono_scaffold01010:10827-11439(+) / protein_length=87 / sequence_SO=supercontig / SO=protein_coding / is_pseudo=false